MRRDLKPSLTMFLGFAIGVGLTLAVCAPAIGAHLTEWVRPLSAKHGAWADVATIGSLPVAAVGIVIAAVTYFSSVDSGRLAHMHGLFGEFLRSELEIKLAEMQSGKAQEEGKDVQGWRDSLDGENLLASRLGFRLYALEEMYLWVRDERRSWVMQFRSRERLDTVAGWERTIASHIRSPSSESLLTHIDLFGDCYSADFLLFLANCLPHIPILEEVILDELSQRQPGDQRRTGSERQRYLQRNPGRVASLLPHELRALTMKPYWRDDSMERPRQWSVAPGVDRQAGWGGRPRPSMRSGPMPGRAGSEPGSMTG